MNVCYWCGREVLDSEGSREHLIPRTLLQDTNEDINCFVIPKENAHKKCNQFLGDNYEHAFCQILFHLTLDDKNAEKHVASKVRNLRLKTNYAQNEFKKMELVNNLTRISISENEKDSFEEMLKKITKGLFFKQNETFLDIENEYSLQYDWVPFNLECDELSRNRTKKYLQYINDQNFVGNDIFKYRFKKTVPGKSLLWEFLFYDRFPAYVFLMHSDDKKT